jgi:hypothetical protein
MAALCIGFVEKIESSLGIRVRVTDDCVSVLQARELADLFRLMGDRILTRQKISCRWRSLSTLRLLNMHK